MKEFIYDDKPKDLCYGCRACEQICSHKAISIYTDCEGFIYPEIDTTKCTECGLCEKICPTQDLNLNRLLNAYPSECYAAWNKNLEERLQSTSGGLFFILAKYFIEQGGIVYGVAMNSELKPEHTRINKITELQKFRGSKYVQSNTLKTFSEVKSDLKNGLKVLYSGTPCQIAGLRSFLMKDYKELYTIDLVCHGTPSPLIFKEHLHYLSDKYKSNVISYQFRAKKQSSWNPLVKIKLENNKEIYSKVGYDFYFHGFCKGWFNRKSCYLCEYSQAKRVGDITLSDFWGAEKSVKILKRQRKYGYNLVICNTEKGMQLYKAILNNIEYIKCDFKIAEKGDIRLREAEEKPLLRDSIYKLINENGYASVIEQYKYKPSIIRKFTPDLFINLVKDIKSRV